MTDLADISRDYWPNGDRYYTDGTMKAPSVTVILGYLEEDQGGLDWWKRTNNGRGNNADHEHLFWYKGVRGTMCHYHGLSRFEDSFYSDDTMFGHGEMEATQQLLDANHDDDIIYSILKDHGYVDDWYDYNTYYDDHTLMDIHSQDVDTFMDGFEEVCDILSIDNDSVIMVEQYVLHDELCYGGQADLLYEDPDGNVVLADIKTSSSLRQKHVLQGVAYKHAIEHMDDIDIEHVDRLEVLRIHPESSEWEIHSNDEATEHHTTEGWFESPYGDWEYESIEEMWDTFERLCIRAHADLICREH